MLLLGCGRSEVYVFDFEEGKDWKKLNGIKIELPKETLLLAEQCNEKIYVMDAFFIEGKNMILSNEKTIVSYEERHASLGVFIKTVYKTSLNNIYLKEIFNVNQIQNYILDSSEYDRVHFLKYINSPWSLVESKTSGRRYYYNCEHQSSTYDRPNDDFLFADPK